MQKTIARGMLGAVLAGAALQIALPAHAEGWEVRATPYLWMMGLDGEIKARGQEVNTSTGFSDIVDNTDIAASMMLEANKGHWVNFAQVDYLKIDTGDVDTRVPGVDAELEFDSTLAALATGYRFQTGERSTLDLMVGLRAASLDAQMSIQNVGDVDADSTVYDAMVMLRPRLSLSKYWYFSPTLSAGAGDSDLVWEMAPELVYDNCGTEIRFGYRNLNYKFEDGDREMDVAMRGPMIGVGFRF